MYHGDFSKNKYQMKPAHFFRKNGHLIFWIGIYFKIKFMITLQLQTEGGTFYC